MRGILLTILILSLSCTKWAEVEETNGIHSIKNIEAEIFKLKDIDWKVGKSRGATVSKGFSFKMDIPKIDKKGREVLLEKYGIDSWIYRVIKKERGRTRRLGLVQFDLSNMSRTSTDITIYIYYHAASISKTFRQFHCPAFGHRLAIDDLNINSDNDGRFNVYSQRARSIKGLVTKPAFAPVIFSGGKELIGEYYVEIALYNSKEKKSYSKFEKLANSISIESEKKISVPSCIGVKEENNPLPSSKTPSIRDFEIK